MSVAIAQPIVTRRPVFRILGIPIDAVQIRTVIAKIEEWIALRESSRFICVANVHVVMEALRNLKFKATLDDADLCVPDGAPLIWLGRSQGYDLPQRCY